MKLKVTEEGVLIPKELLGNSLEVEISRQEEKIIITIINKPTSIWDLGKDPVESDINDGAINHDRYLYNP